MAISASLDGKTTIEALAKYLYRMACAKAPRQSFIFISKARKDTDVFLADDGSGASFFLLGSTKQTKSAIPYPCRGNSLAAKIVECCDNSTNDRAKASTKLVSVLLFAKCDGKFLRGCDLISVLIVTFLFGNLAPMFTLENKSDVNHLQQMQKVRCFPKHDKTLCAICPKGSLDEEPFPEQEVREADITRCDNDRLGAPHTGIYLPKSFAAMSLYSVPLA
ncbi:MAG: hypothetical protein M1469_02000 [Bacteroidetes bacterium]|nr:hypothetical protein [Bacteroidota bacterium]